MPRLLVIGLDCAPPSLVFDRFAEAMPFVSKLRSEGSFGVLRSTAPPITMPAWASMATGRDPGELGIYGFRNRDEGYGLRIATAKDLPYKRVWDHLGEAGFKVAPLFVPPTYPVPAVRGVSIGCFLTPEDSPKFAFPPRFQRELEERFGPHRPDVMNFRADDPDAVRDELFSSTKERFEILRYVLETHRPDLTFFVEMGTDRLHHAFFHHFFEDYPRFDPEGAYREIGREYYAFIDREIETTVMGLGDEKVDLLIVSDHGARPMLSGIAVNELLRERGYLHLKRTPEGPVAFADAEIDWSRTRAFSEGGYYARVFLNIKGREPEGIVHDRDVPPLLDELERLFLALPDENGAPMKTIVHRPEAVYRRTRGRAPDLMVYLDNLNRRSLGKLGLGGIHHANDDRGPDACNHDWDGIYIANGPNLPKGMRERRSILDIFPTILELFAVEPPSDLIGKSFISE